MFNASQLTKEELDEFSKDVATMNHIYMSGQQSTSLQPDVSPEEPHIDELIKNLWTLDLDVAIPLDETGGPGLSSPWEFRDILPPNTRHLRNRILNAKGEIVEIPVAFPSTVDSSEIVQKKEVPAPSITPIPTATLSQGNGKQEVFEKKMTGLLNPADYRIFPLQLSSTYFVDFEAAFVVQEKYPRKNRHFKTELTRPDGSTEILSLSRDPNSSSGRFFCMFYPRETGPHLLSASVSISTPIPGSSSNSSTKGVSLNQSDTAVPVTGSPIVITAVRFYPYSNGFNSLRMGFRSMEPVCVRAWGIAVHRPTNLIYLADREDHNIVVIDPNSAPGKIVNKFGAPGSGPGQLYRPTGISIDHCHRRVVIGDKENHRVSIFSLEGVFQFSFGKRGFHDGEFNYPWGLAVSPNGQLIAVADSKNHRIQLFDSKGTFLRKFSVFETRPFEYVKEFNYPRGVAFNLNGTQIFVTDFNLNSVFSLNVDLTLKETFVPQGYLLRPQGLTVDEADNVIITDSKHNCLHVVSPLGKHIWTFPGSGQDQFEGPLDVAILKGGRVATIDGHNRLRIF